MQKEIFFIRVIVFKLNNVEDSTGTRAIEYDLSNVSVHYSLFLLALVFVSIDDGTVLCDSTGST